MKVALLMSLGFALSALACGDAGEKDDMHGIALTVSPLELEGIEAACYDLRVRAGDDVPQDVIVRGDPTLAASDGDARPICSDQFGNGAHGDIFYVAPCDASASGDTDPVREGVQNDVTVWVDGLYLTGPEGYTPIAGSWQNPCTGEGCTVVFDCVENVDTAVLLSLTILRQGHTGFFDITVDFEDIFCAAKVDCRYVNETETIDDDTVIRLVNDLGGTKLPTAVLAIACSAGPGDEGTTRLYMSDVEIDCSGEEDDVTIPVGEPDDAFETDPPGVVAQAMVFHGEDNLVEEDRMYWNVAVALEPSDDSDPLAPLFGANDCVLRASATVSAGDIDDVLAGPNVTYPYIRAEVALTDADGALVCTRHPINGGNGFDTLYSGLEGLPEEITWEMVQLPEGEVSVGRYTRP